MPFSATSDYAAINARVRVKYSTLLSTAEIIGLTETADLGGMLNGLKTTAYGPYLEMAKDKELTARRAAFLMRQRLSEAYHSIIQFSPNFVKSFLLEFYRLNEVNNLKAVLRGITTQSSWDRVRYVLFPNEPEGCIPAQAMVETANVVQAVELLHGTPYYKPLSFAMKRYSAEQNLFPIEVALDLDYWRNLWRDIKKLPSTDQDYATRIIGPLLDMNNLMWAIRYRFYHNLSEEEVINYTLPFGYKVHDREIRSIAAGADIPPIIKQLYPDIQGVDDILCDLHSGLPMLELVLEKRIIKKCHDIFLGDPFHIGIPLGFLVLLDFEIRDLVVLLEAKSESIPVDEYSMFLTTELSK